MPPKSPNRSGKSTPTRGRPGDKKEDDKQSVDEEEARLQAEEEERKRKEKEEKERLELERLEILSKIRDAEENETRKELEAMDLAVEQVNNDRRANAQWERYMKCEGKPDPTSAKEINTFISLEKENGKPDLNIVLDDAELILSLIDELKFLLEDSVLNDEVIAEYKQTLLSLQELLRFRYNEATLKLLKEASFEADSETGNLQKVVKGNNEVIMLWGNLNKNPRFKGYEFESEKIMFELPKVLAMSDIAVRILRDNFDHYSHQSTTFLAKVKQQIQEEVEEKADAVDVAEDGKKEEGGEASDADEDEKSDLNDGRKSGMSGSSDKVEEENKEEDVKENESNEDGESRATPEIKIDTEDDEILDPDVVDLRQCTPLGGVYHIDLVKLPPQPKVVGGWTLTQIIDEPLMSVKYPSENLGKSPSRVPSATPEGRDGTEGVSPSKTPLEQQQPPIGVTMTLPDDVAFFEEPQVARWDDADKHWKTSCISDLNYEEEKRVLSFKTSQFGSFCLLQDTYLNMPFQSWELVPRGLNECQLTVTAAIAEIQIQVKGRKCMLVKPDENIAQLSHIYDHWMGPKELVTNIQNAGVNIFPAADAYKFATIQDKSLDMNAVYHQMALLSSAFAFAWSKWNSEAEKNMILFQVAPLYVTNDPRPVPDDDWSIFACSNDRCYKTSLQEYDESYSNDLSSHAEYHCDIIHALRMTSLKGDPEGQLLTSLVKRSHACDVFHVNTVLTLLKATQVISFS